MNKSYFQRGPNVKNPLNSINVIKNLPAKINQSFQIKINKPSILKRTGQFLYHFMDPWGPLLYFILLEVFSFLWLRYVEEEEPQHSFVFLKNFVEQLWPWIAPSVEKIDI